MDPSKEVQLESYIKKVEARLARLETRDLDLKGRGAVNARDGVQLQDYVTLSQVSNLIQSSLSSQKPGAGADFICALAGASGTQSIPLTTFTAIEFDTTLIGSSQNIHNPSTNPTRFTINKPGYYISFCQSTYIGAVGMTLISLQQAINGSTPSYSATDTRLATTLGNPTTSVYNINFLNSGDYVEFFTYHNGGGAESTAAEGSFAGVLKVG